MADGSEQKIARAIMAEDEVMAERTEELRQMAELLCSDIDRASQINNMADASPRSYHNMATAAMLTADQVKEDNEDAETGILRAIVTHNYTAIVSPLEAVRTAETSMAAADEPGSEPGPASKMALPERPEEN